VRCTCGAFPPEDARFCHKCGRPLREDEPEPESVDSPPPAPPVATPPASVASGIAINFHNRRAVGVSILVAAVTLLLLLPMSVVAPSLAPVLFAGGGFLASQLYRRGSGEPFTPQNGARMGFMTSLWSFLVLLVMYTAFAIPNYLELVYLVTAFVPSLTACLANSPGNRSLTAVCISREVMVERLL